MNNYITPEEFTQLGGVSELNHLDIFQYQTQFDSALHPNTYMIRDWSLANDGLFPLEIKMAFTKFINHLIINGDNLFAPPVGGVTVGTTSIDYVNGALDVYGSPKLLITPEVKMILKRTNILNPMASMKRMHFIGTRPEFVTPGQQAITTTIQQGKGNLPTLEAMSVGIPKLLCEFKRLVENVSGGVVVDEDLTHEEYEVVGEAYCTHEDITSEQNTYGYLIAPPHFISGDEFKIKTDYRVFVHMHNGDVKEYGIEDYHVYNNNNEVHHTRITLE